MGDIHVSDMDDDRRASDKRATPRFLRRFEAGDLATRAVLHEMVTYLAQCGLSEDDLANAELILAEALNNVTEHAYAEGEGPVELLVEVQRGGLLCRVSDRGRGLPDGCAPDPGLPAINPPVDLPEGGFGWHIIRCLTRDLSYRRDGAWNRLSLRVPWADLD
jgi:serine/threonine-protein kinase RsbW